MFLTRLTPLSCTATSALVRALKYAERSIGFGGGITRQGAQLVGWAVGYLFRAREIASTADAIDAALVLELARNVATAQKR